MSHRIDEKKIELFISLFKGRNDIYAKRWEKDGRTGYMPAYQVDWSDYNKHKASGGTFSNYDKKEFLPFSTDAVIEHLTGRPFDYKVDHYETISQILVHDTQRNQMIIEDIESQIERCNSILVLTERKVHVNIINLYLKDRFETITITGDDSESARQSKLEQIKAGHYKIVLSTGQFFGEGIDVSNLECLFLVYPFAFEGKLIQYIGRIQHSEKPPIIFDYRDKKIDYFEKLFKQRNRYYKKLYKSQEE